MLNALVLYVATQALSTINNKQPLMSSITHTAHMDIFQNLAVDLDTEGRYLFLNAMANHLRYPNTHTHYFSYITVSGKFVELPSHCKRETYGFHHCVERPFLGWYTTFDLIASLLS